MRLYASIQGNKKKEREDKLGGTKNAKIYGQEKMMAILLLRH